jgi:ribosomal protein L11 methyltransferase
MNPHSGEELKNRSLGPPEPDGAPPHPYLYIYYIAGRVPVHAAAGLGCDYLGNWQEGETAFLFFGRPADGAVDALLESRPELCLQDRFEIGYEDWHGGELRPFTAGRLQVTPAWLKTPVEPGKNRILLDPGVVFGAGNHPTTRHCLDALQWFMDRDPVDTVLDLGAGTGLLSLAAASLGAVRALAVDNNFLAAATAIRNIHRNRLQDRCFSVCAAAEDFIEAPADLVVANIHYDVMAELVASPGFRQKRRFILSGLMRTQAEGLKSAVFDTGARIVSEQVQDGIWHTLCGIRP